MLPAALTALALISAALHIRAEYRGPRNQVYIFKPLTTSLIFSIALAAPFPGPSIYKLAILVGLAASLAGDIFLMLPSDRFLNGLLSFLVAHVAYIVAFSTGLGSQASPLFGLPFLVYALALYLLLRPNLRRMNVPVLVYSLVASVMGWRALDRWLVFRSPASLLTLIGAVLFILSDSILGINRFARSFRSAQALILTTYYSAQWFIALSVWGTGSLALRAL